MEETKEYTISALSDNLGANVKRIWAQKKVSELEQNSKENKDEIKELCMKYGLVSDYTSLIVLETVWDYIQYEIEPPAELRKEYDRIKKGGKNRIESTEDLIVEDDIVEEESFALELSEADILSTFEEISSDYGDIQSVSLSIVGESPVDYEMIEEVGDTVNEEDEIYVRVEKKAEFQGGRTALVEYLKNGLGGFKGRALKVGDMITIAD